MTGEGSDRLLVIAGWAVPAEMLAGLYQDWPGQVVTVSLDDELLARCGSVSDVADTLLLLYPEPAVWLGWSLGAQVAMAAAARHTGTVRRVVTMAGFPKFLATESWPTGMPPAEFAAFARGIEQDPQRYWQRFMGLMIKGCGDERGERRRLKGWLDRGVPLVREHLLKSLEWLGHADQRAIWRALDIPALHLLGGRDAVVRSWCAAAPVASGASVTVVPNMAHWPGGRYAGDCLERIRYFLATEAVQPRGVCAG